MGLGPTELSKKPCNFMGEISLGVILTMLFDFLQMYKIGDYFELNFSITIRFLLLLS
jgi:hypothetical protein